MKKNKIEILPTHKITQGIFQVHQDKMDITDMSEPKQEPIEEINESIYSVCSACGITANYLTCLKKYGKPPIKPCFDCSTYHKGKCDVCGHERMVTESRDFFYPDFSLITKKIKCQKN